MLATAIQLLKNPTKTVSLFLLAGTIALSALYAWERVEVSTLKSSLYIKGLELKRAKQSLESCKNALSKLVESNKKKHLVIKEYETKILKGEKSEQINSVSDYINFANGLQ